MSSQYIYTMNRVSKVVPPKRQIIKDISLSFFPGAKIGLLGLNGAGKSTVLRIMAGVDTDFEGEARPQPGIKVGYLAQEPELNPEHTVLEHMQAANRQATDSDLRMRLAQLDLDTQKIMVPSGLLSGGERLKAALACALYADETPQLLLLDEPGNHLDLPSVQALEAMLGSYRGAMIVVSHDDVFMDKLGLTDRLQATAQGWILDAW